jgi:hypothetical protein
MVSSCSNPACDREVQLLNMGKLYAFERRSVPTEFFWLCADCPPLVALFLDPMGCVSVRPRSDPGSPQPPHPECDLRLVAGSEGRTRWRWSSLVGGLTRSNGFRRNLPPLSSDAA